LEVTISEKDEQLKTELGYETPHYSDFDDDWEDDFEDWDDE
jgi:hypothetical protein